MVSFCNHRKFPWVFQLHCNFYRPRGFPVVAKFVSDLYERNSFSDEWTGWKVRQVSSHDQGHCDPGSCGKVPRRYVTSGGSRGVEAGWEGCDTVLAPLHSFSSIQKKKKTCQSEGTVFWSFFSNHLQSLIINSNVGICPLALLLSCFLQVPNE